MKIKITFWNEPTSQRPIEITVNRVEFYREHLRLSPKDWLVQKEKIVLWDEYPGEDYPDRTLASAEQTGDWWLRTEGQWYSYMKMEVCDD